MLTLVFLCSLVSAQEKGNIVERIVRDFFDGIVNPDLKGDPAYITRPALPWAFTVDNTLISTGVKLHGDMDDAVFDTRLQRHLHKKIGVSGGYGGLSLSAGTEIGSRNPGKNSFMSLSLSSRSIGGSVSYVKLHEYMDGSLHFKGTDLAPVRLISEYPAAMRTLSGNVYYVLNSRRFAYKAVTSCNVMQLRSAGSLVIMAKFSQGDISLDPRDYFMLASTDGLYRYTIQQGSMGVGYSYNFVPFSRESSNLVFNFTAIPMASLYNNIYSVNKDEGKDRKTRFDSSMVPVLMLRSGVSYSWDRYGLMASVVYNRFGFKGESTTISSSAMFDDLTAKISLIVRL